MGLAVPRLARGSNVLRSGRGRLEEGETSEVTVERGDRNLHASTLSVMVADSRMSDGRVYDEEESRTCYLSCGWANDG